MKKGEEVRETKIQRKGNERKEEDEGGSGTCQEDTEESEGCFTVLLLKYQCSLG